MMKMTTLKCAPKRRNHINARTFKRERRARAAGERRQRRGFTFIEVLAAVALLIIGFLGTFASLHASGLLREAANETNVAMFKLQTVMEYAFNLPFDDLTLKLPADTAIDLTAISDSASENDLTLRDEKITIAYEDPAADPIKFTITINWTTRSGSARHANISSGRVR